MKRIGFHPEEVLFSPSTKCNLSCGHCDIRQSGESLSSVAASGFLDECKRLGLRRVGFTGGEPFLAIDFLCALTRSAVKRGFLFDRIMTNAVWWRDENDLKVILIKLFNAGYDGSICVSLDAFHKQDIYKVALFIRLAERIWNRPDIISIAYVRGARDVRTKEKIAKLNKILKGRPAGSPLRLLHIDISPLGKASRYAEAWGDKWFKEDYCQGPGNVFFVMPDGGVKPCCGYANDRSELSIGSIKSDSVKDIMKNVRNNKFVDSVFNRGLSRIRKALEASGVKFPGKTESHCYFCDYILTRVPRSVLTKCLTSLLLAFLLLATDLCAQELIAGKDLRKIPATVIKKFSVPRGYHEGLFYDGKSLWLANGDKRNILVIDPSSGIVTSSVRGVSDFVEAFIKTDDGSAFSTEWNTKKIYRVKIEGGGLLPDKEASFDPAHPAGLICAGKRLFVVTWTRGFGTKFHIVELDAELNIINRVVIKEIQEPDQLAWDGRDLWISSWYSRAVYRVNIERWEISGYFKSPVSKTTGIAWDGRYMWLTGTYSDLYRIDIGK